jgi:exosortase
LIAIGLLIFLVPIRLLAQLSFQSELYSHFVLIPVVSLFFLLTEGKTIFKDTKEKALIGLAVCAAALVIYFIAIAFKEQLPVTDLRGKSMPNDYLTLCMVGFVVWIIGGFITIYGVDAFKRARFPLLFLFFIVPIPMFILKPTIKALQYTSAEAANLIFALTGAPYFRDGLIFELPGVVVRVAEVCSGIRSSLALLILSIITGHMFLKRMSRKILLAVIVFPITVIKNAARIVTLTMLASYVDKSFLTNHWLHSSGGIPFFAVALTLFIPMVWLLRRTERREVK